MLAIEMGSKVGILHIPALGRQVEVACTGIVGHDGAVSLVHLPVAHQSGQVGSNRLIFLSQQGAHGTIPEIFARKFADVRKNWEEIGQ